MKHIFGKIFQFFSKDNMLLQDIYIQEFHSIAFAKSQQLDLEEIKGL